MITTSVHFSQFDQMSNIPGNITYDHLHFTHTNHNASNTISLDMSHIKEESNNQATFGRFISSKRCSRQQSTRVSNQKFFLPVSHAGTQDGFEQYLSIRLSARMMLLPLLFPPFLTFFLFSFSFKKYHPSLFFHVSKVFGV